MYSPLLLPLHKHLITGGDCLPMGSCPPYQCGTLNLTANPTVLPTLKPTDNPSSNPTEQPTENVS